MLVFEKNMLVDEIESLTSQYGKSRSSLLPILQAIQNKYQYISDFAQQEIAAQLGLHPVEVYSVVSFYTFLHCQPKGKNIVRLCKTISCEFAGKCSIEKAIERELGISFGQTTKDQKISLEFTNCLGMCDQGPAMIVNERVYTKLTAEKAVHILSEIK